MNYSARSQSIKPQSKRIAFDHSLIGVKHDLYTTGKTDNFFKNPSSSMQISARKTGRTTKTGTDFDSKNVYVDTLTPLVARTNRKFANQDRIIKDEPADLFTLQNRTSQLWKK